MARREPLDMLLFDGRKGYAKADGVFVELSELPAIDALPTRTSEIYYFPQLKDYRLRESEEVRTMRPPEIAAVIAFLTKIAEFGRCLRSKKPSP